jgi:hypothetical protein
MKQAGRAGKREDLCGPGSIDTMSGPDYVASVTEALYRLKDRRPAAGTLR